MKRIFSLILVLIAMHAAFAQVVAVDLTRKNLYVKEKGTGNGSTWKDAMGPQTFAYYLPQAKDGTTFHVAEGTYYPMYDSKMVLATGKDGNSAVYTVNSDVTIKGGYSPDPKEGDVSDPSKYKATFSGDFGNDDKVEFAKDEKGDYFLSHKNYEDNAFVLFYIALSKKTNLRFENVVLTNSNDALHLVRNAVKYQDVNMFLKNVSFENNKSTAIINDNEGEHV